MSLKKVYVCLFLCLITLGLFYPLLSAPFNSVDDLALEHYLLNLDTFSFVSHFFPGGEHNYYRPILMLTYILDQSLWGADPSFMHLENILLHLLNVILVYFISFNICRALSFENAIPPFFSAILFAIHPINVESIAWVVGRTDLLAGFFVLLALLLLLSALRLGQLRHGLLGALFLLMGCLSKETALFFIPGAFFLIFLPGAASSWFVRADSPFRVMLFLCYGLAVASYFLLRFFAVSSDRGVGHIIAFVDNAPSESISETITAFVSLLGLFFKASGFYLKKLIFPWPLNFGIIEVHDLYVIPGLLLGVTLVCFLMKRNLLTSLFLACAFLGSSALLAVFTGGMWTPFAERYMYLPCALFVMGVTSLAWKFIENKKKTQKLLVFILPFLLASTAYATVSRCLIWQDNETLFRDTVEKSPSFDDAKNELAIALQNKGKTEEYLEIRRNLKVHSSQVASLNEALLKYREGDSEVARKMLLKRLETPDRLEGTVLEVLVKMTLEMAVASSTDEENLRLSREALIWLGRLHELSGDPFYSYRMGSVHLQLKEFEAAQELFAKAAEEFPEDSVYKKPSQKLAERLNSP